MKAALWMLLIVLLYSLLWPAWGEAGRWGQDRPPRPPSGMVRMPNQEWMPHDKPVWWVQDAADQKVMQWGKDLAGGREAYHSLPKRGFLFISGKAAELVWAIARYGTKVLAILGPLTWVPNATALGDATIPDADPRIDLIFGLSGATSAKTVKPESAPTVAPTRGERRVKPAPPPKVEPKPPAKPPTMWIWCPWNGRLTPIQFCRPNRF